MRAYLGFDRLNTVEQTVTLNHLYDKLWLYYNFFQPVMRLSQKTITPLEGQPPMPPATMTRCRRPLIACVLLAFSPTPNVKNYIPCVTAPTPASYAKRSTPCSTISLVCQARSRASPKMSTLRWTSLSPYRKEWLCQ